VINAVSLYVEHGAETFYSVHVAAAARLARACHAACVERLIHISGIGADTASASPYISSRGTGEQKVRAAFPAATIVRPAVMFGPDDAFLTSLAGLLRALPLFPLFGRGQTRVQPSHVDDVADAIARILAMSAPTATYELGGPRIYAYEDLIRVIGREIGATPVLIPVPFRMWKMLALGAEALPHPPLTRNQVELMTIDTVVAPEYPGFSALRIEPRGIETVLTTLRRKRDRHEVI
jgi:NADH dehydrogenase